MSTFYQDEYMLRIQIYNMFLHYCSKLISGKVSFLINYLYFRFFRHNDDYLENYGDNLYSNIDELMEYACILE